MVTSTNRINKLKNIDDERQAERRRANFMVKHFIQNKIKLNFYLQNKETKYKNGNYDSPYSSYYNMRTYKTLN